MTEIIRSETFADYAHPDALVSTASIAENLADPALRLVEVHVDITGYDSGHVQGAEGWNWQTDPQRRPVRDISSKEEWEALLSRSGIRNATTEILYGDHHNWFAAFAYCRIGERSAHTPFALHDLLGYPSVKNYDGSWTAWGSLVGPPIETESEA